MDLNQTYSDLKTNFPNLEIYQNHPLAPYTTVKIGGPADIFIHTTSSNDFTKILKYLSHQPITIIGNGSNVLISDSGISGIVIKNNSKEIEILPNNQVKVASGVQLSTLINFTLDHNLLGLEEFSYIPSTIGGAIAGNIHGDNKTLFSEFVDSIKEYNDFIISAVLKLKPGNSTFAKQKTKEIIQKKSAIQPMNSLGSVFKNIEGKDPTGMIIDQQLNLKGFSIGDAQISPTHANFIINNGHTTAIDYFNLIQLIQSKAQEILGFQFELEIKLLGEF
ncbi:MAG: FAD-binding protein [Candidatus Shapirobacteria bacterium]|nr:FAD-binding protein [Candidatus Shapirobacteria bacterium]